MRRAVRARAVTPALLRRHPLPAPDAQGDKDARGRVLAVGGSIQVPGALLLAGVAALRAGAGKLQLATVGAASIPLGIAVPEALVIGLPTTRAGEIAGSSGGQGLVSLARGADAVLVGPGMADPRSARGLLRVLVRRMPPDALLVLDAAAILALRGTVGMLSARHGRAVLTPHAGEMASLLEVDKREVERAPWSMAREAARRFGATVALKGPDSWIASPDGTLYCYSEGTVGLATSGSGDTLAGIVAGLAARGASAERAAMWGAYLHGAAGGALASRVGPLGFLARELLDEIPGIMATL